MSMLGALYDKYIGSKNKTRKLKSQKRELEKVLEEFMGRRITADVSDFNKYDGWCTKNVNEALDGDRRFREIANHFERLKEPPILDDRDMSQAFRAIQREIQRLENEIQKAENNERTCKRRYEDAKAAEQASC